MDTAGIAELLWPFVPGGRLSPELLQQLQQYLELLLRWNARMNLTAVRRPEAIVTRPFGESLFAARVLFEGGSGLKPPFPGEGFNAGLKAGASTMLEEEHYTDASAEVSAASGPRSATLADVGSGAGFPGIPIKFFVPQIELTLIESQHKKAAFLREVVRILHVHGAVVFSGRAEQWGKKADVVTLRAVEQFERALPVAAGLVEPRGRLCLLISSRQVEAARALLGDTWHWAEPVAIPQSAGRVVLVAQRG